ncbi:MAG TPA: hypothetical protein VIJ87_14565, partial [Pyrinomonadaceae bacterium]
FNTRAAASAPEPPAVQSIDMAVAAAALHYLKQQKRGTGSTTVSVPNRWRMSGRSAALSARQNVGERVPSEWRKR